MSSTDIPKEILSELSVERIRKHVEHIVTNIPSRLAGSENARRMAEYSRDQISAAGLDARIETTPALVSFPKEAELRVLSPREMTLPANTFGHSVLTDSAGLTGELVYVRNGYISDYDGKDVVGKITLSELSYSPGRHEKQRIAGMMGSTAQIMRNWGPADSESVPFGSVKPAWGVPTPESAKTEMPTIPCLGISRVAGKQLLDMLDEGPVTVSIRTDVDNAWRDIHLTVAEMQGKSDDFVLVGGHQDSWYGEASTDNAAGNACMLELARVFHKHRDRLRRGVVFAFWSAHETGTMSGSAWFADRYWERLRKHAVAYLMIDQPAMLGTSRWAAHSNVEMQRFQQQVEKDVLSGDVIQEWHLAQKVGDTSFFGIGIPSLWAEGGFTPDELNASALATCGWWHHSLDCTIDKLDWTWMEDHIRVYAGYLWKLCTAAVLPYEFVSVADQFKKRLVELAPLGRGLDLEGVIARVERFRATAEKLAAVAAHWDAKADDKGADAPVEALNACIKGLSRILIPMLSTDKGAYGHDTYSYTPQSTLIPSLYDVQQLGRLTAEGPEKWQLMTKLMRQRNRLADALAQAEDLTERTLADVARMG